jgi:hypothetical protein
VFLFWGSAWLLTVPYGRRFKVAQRHDAQVSAACMFREREKFKWHPDTSPKPLGPTLVLVTLISLTLLWFGLTH